MEHKLKSIFMQPEKFKNGERFNQADLTEWMMISSSDKDHYGDIMKYAPSVDGTFKGMVLPPDGKGIMLLNHEKGYTAGVTLGEVLEYQVVEVGPIQQLWQKGKYSTLTPVVETGEGKMSLGELVFKCRQRGIFKGCSIQFVPEKWAHLDGGGVEYQTWKLVEAGPVVIPANWHTQDVKEFKNISAVVAKAAGFKLCQGCGKCREEQETKDGLIPLSEGEGLALKEETFNLI